MGGPVSGRLAALLLVGFATLSCTRVEQARRCRELAETVNPRLAKIEGLAEGDQAPQSLQSIADLYDGIADDLGPLEFHSQSLALAVKEYGRQLRGIAVEARKAAEALEAKDKTAYSNANRQVRSRTTQLKATQRQIETACR